MQIIIDNIPVECQEGESILEVALRNNIYIPHLCKHPDLEASGGCRLCSVEIEGEEFPKPACSTYVKDGMKITVRGPKADETRKMAMELILAGHPSDCTGCPKYGKCELQSMYQFLGVSPEHWHKTSKPVADNKENPLIMHLLIRCVRCGRCVHACRDMRGVKVLDYRHVKGEIRIGTAGNVSLAEAGCRFCGACIEVCPTGSIMDQLGLISEDITYADSVVPCRAACPAHISIPEYIRAVKEGDCDSAVGIIREKVPFPHALGLVCNNRCEEKCKRGELNDPLSIRNLKRFAAENDKTQSWKEKYTACAPDTGKKVAIIGGGACGLTAGYYLRKKGHDVTVFEAKKIPGGHMTSGMPAYRIPTEAVLDEVKVIEETGVKIVCDKKIENAAELKKDYDAVLVAIGTSVGKKLMYLPGADLPQVYTALDVLQAQRLGIDYDFGQTVNIIGGGNVAFDAAGTLVRMGKTVNVVCLEKDASQATPSERDAALEEGANLFDSHSNEAILAENGRVSGLQVHKINSFSFDPDTRALIEDAVPDSTYVIPCDSIVFAAGQVTGLTDAFGIELNKFGYPIDPATGKSEYTTSVDGVFAAGDVITGTKFLIDAIAGARDVAVIMDKYLGGDGQIDEQLVERKADPYIGRIEGFAGLARTELKERDAEERKKDFDVSSLGFTCEEGHCEAERCLQCDLRLNVSRPHFWSDFK